MASSQLKRLWKSVETASDLQDILGVLQEKQAEEADKAIAACVSPEVTTSDGDGDSGSELTRRCCSRVKTEDSFVKGESNVMRLRLRTR